MSIDLTQETITAAVQETFDGATSERMRETLPRLVQHLHDFAREVRLTSAEWFAAVDFLESVGHISSPTRQEFVLLSDILGLSVLVDQINHGNGSATDSTLLGPFYVEGRPRVANGADISGGMPVVDPEGRPVAGALVDTWHSDGDGYYDVQQADKLHGAPAMRHRDERALQHCRVDFHARPGSR
jgi:hydroxyquinol 1,2-dioxygenase